MITRLLLKKSIPLLLLVSCAQADTSVSQIYVFGDSLSDTGNAASVVGDLPPPFFMNRISNGPVAVETLAARLGLTADASLHLLGAAAGTNYAVAGANAFGLNPEDLSVQTLSFRINHGFEAPSDALYVIFIGGNDVRSARGETGFIRPWLAVRAAAFKARRAIRALARDGARSFLLVNSPDIGALPETRLIAEAINDPAFIVRARRLSDLYRRALRELIDDLEADYEDQSEFNIVEFDLFGFFDELLENADELGFTNSTDACFTTETLSFHPDCDFGNNFDQFVFFDEIHPTAATHALAGEAMFEALQNDYGN